MFFTYLKTDPHFFTYAVVTMVFSVVLHELAHGVAAIWQGDRTPIEAGHLTIDPRVHMGAVSLLMLVVCGVCYGAMPVDPRRFRSRYGNLLVAAAGPLMNLLLALLALTALGLWMLGTDPGGPTTVVHGNLRSFLWTFGYCNVALCLFNLIPIPPLDGSTVLAGCSRTYARWLERVRDPRVFLLAFVVVFAVLSSPERNLYGFAATLGEHYLKGLYSLAGR